LESGSGGNFLLPSCIPSGGKKNKEGMGKELYREVSSLPVYLQNKEKYYSYSPQNRFENVSRLPIL